MDDASLGPCMVNFLIEGIVSEPNSIYPRLRLNIKITYRSRTPNDKVTINHIFGKAYLVTKDKRSVYIRDIISDIQIIQMHGDGYSVLPFYLTIDYFGLSQIEKLRENSDLNLRFELCLAYRIEQPSSGEGTIPIVVTSPIGVSYKIPKSDWVEKLLTELKYKQVFLLEIPKLENGEFTDVILYLDDAQKDLSIGDYSNVFIDCQKALEVIKNITLKKGFKKEINGKTKIDFNKLFNSETIADSIGSIWSNLFSYLQPGGRHHGVQREREDAQFAILSTYGLVNILMKYIGQQNGKN